MIDRRSSGILLHPTSLPGGHGIGDLGSAIDTWLPWLATTECGYWQILPLGPTGYGDSPYQCFSAFAGNPLLISLNLLVEEGLLPAAALEAAPGFPDDVVDFGSVIPWKSRILDMAAAHYRTSRPADVTADYRRFIEENGYWLHDFGLFMAIKASHGGGPWWDWPDPLRRADPDALREARHRLTEDIDRHLFRQFLFFRQWARLREKAASLGIEIIGDIPIFVAEDSVDVWSRPNLFVLDEERRPTYVAGVPPDYFSETGQLWGNPLYDWTAHASDGYSWWVERMRHTTAMVDVVRIDHFRGFVDFWEIPAGSDTAVQGRWVEGPGRAVFDAIEGRLGDLPIIAEDLGELHPEVPALRDELALPGMKILQFAFDEDEESDFLPSRYPVNCVVYTGTHDNDTALGWYQVATPRERLRARWHLKACGPATSIPRRMIAVAWRSRAILAVAPMQDVLGLDGDARMNTPSTQSGNWRWRLPACALDDPTSARLRKLNRATGRSAGSR